MMNSVSLMVFMISKNDNFEVQEECN